MIITNKNCGGKVTVKKHFFGKKAKKKIRNDGNDSQNLHSKMKKWLKSVKKNIFNLKIQKYDQN
jgi:hypothetical protein